MTYDTLKKEIGRKPLTVVDLVLDYCSNTYGVSPCAASLTAGNECYNTYKTCQDTANYAKTTKTYRFVENVADLPAGLNIFPALENVTLAPSKIEPNGIGQRASVTITLRDFPYHDRGIDKYINNRTYDAYETGTFFGKLKARNSYYLNRKIIIRTGYINDDNFDTSFLTDFQARTYFIDRFEGPDAKGIVKIIAKDVLKLADNKKAKAPTVSDGVLDSAITSSDTSLTLKNGYTTSYASSGTIRINSEIISYTGKRGDTLTGLSRGQYNTTASSHSADDTVQVCLVYNSQKPTDVLEDLLKNYADVDPAFIPSADWLTENDEKLSGHSFTTQITEPTGVKNLVEEILQSTLSYLWWDEIDQQIKFKVSFPIDRRTNFTEIDELNNIIENSVFVRDEEKKRVSEVIVYYNQFNPVEYDKKTNFSNVYAKLDTDAESDNKYGAKATLEVISRWQSSEGAASEIAGRTLNLFKETPKIIKFKLDAKDSYIKTGDIIGISTRSIQNAGGAENKTDFLITKRTERVAGSVYEYEALEFALGSKIAYISPNTILDYTLESDANKKLYGFISDNFGFMSNGDDGYKIA